jgi:asparagine synthase (glutamine-hydrolysing)
MCGICGKINFDLEKPVDRDLVQRMTKTMTHRGPDQSGYFFEKNVGLGHRRLNIIDLSTGEQPISNEDDNLSIIYNGEIYNYQYLREDLLQRGHVFKTKSDTEVILHLYEEYGPASLQKLRGMFPFAIYDKRDKSLFIARDRVGIKPLYYSYGDCCLVFGSEIKSIIEEPTVDTSVNYEGIYNFLSYSYTPGPDTVFKNIHKLQPGHYLIQKNGKTTIEQYWDIDEFYMSDMEINGKVEDELEKLLEETINIHMISDVPVGFLLSGGIDSTTTLSFYTDKQKSDVKTFTIGFESDEFEDERKYARLAADKFGVDHYETTINEEDFFNFFPKYLWHMEEPIFEPPAISLYYVSKMASEHVKVLLSGEGGDEAFAGYQTYRNLVWLERIKKLTGSTNGHRSKLISRMIPPKYRPLLHIPINDYYFSRSASPSSLFIKESDTLYSNPFKEQILLTENPYTQYADAMNGVSDLKRMLYVDTKTWLPDRLLTKADKMTMANSIELRVPMLDHVLLEFAAQLPDKLKLNGFNTKHILKKVASKRIPREIIKRKKAGFPTPFSRWLKNKENLVTDILTDPSTLNRGYFDNDKLNEIVLNPWRRNGSHSMIIFNLLTLEIWHREFVNKKAEMAVI